MNGSIPLLLKAGVLTLAVAAAWGSSLFLTVFVFLFCLLPTEQIFQNLRQEYSRIQRRRQLEGAFNQTEACSSSDAPSPSSSLNAPSSPPGRFTALHTQTAWGFNSAPMRLQIVVVFFFSAFRLQAKPVGTACSVRTRWSII